MIFVFLLCGMFIACLMLAYRNGKAENTADTRKRQLDAEKDADRIRDRLLHDPDYADRVRKRFTR